MDDGLALQPEQYCSHDSVAQGETQWATAEPELIIWLILEYDAPWRTKAVTDNDLPPLVQTWLDSTIAALPGSRVQFIKRPDSAPRPTRRFYVALSREQAPTLYRFDLQTYEELLSFDVADLVANETNYAAYHTAVPLYLVCTNGKRDKCCAKFGRPIFDVLAAQSATALAAPEPAQVWQSTHIGGHRYAATLLLLPYGLYYGRLSKNTAVALLHATNDSQILLPHYRGRCCYAAVVQAADYLLRQETGRHGFTDLRWLSTTPLPEEQFAIRFALTAAHGQETVHHLTVEMKLSPPVWASCSQDAWKPRPLFRLINHTQQ